MFRSGSTGIALLIVRLSLIGTLLLHTFRFAPNSSLFWSMPLVLLMPVVLIAAALGLGVMTAASCVVYCAAEAWFAFGAVSFDATIPILSIPVAIALALMGPGAYSLDARIFGRRVIVLPPEDDN